MSERVKLDVPLEGNKKLEEIIRRVNSNNRLLAYLRASNVMSIDRLGFNDHGPVHVKIVANIALKILRILVKNGLEPSLVKNYRELFSYEDSEVLLYLASILHDVGMAIGREKHDELGLVLIYPLIQDLLNGIYDEEREAIMTTEILHAVSMHDRDVKPLTLEARILRIADALDMEKGRARIPFKSGIITIHSVSAMAIDKVEVKEGKEKPVSIKIKMSNPAGIFQVDELLKKKIKIAELQDYVELEVLVKGWDLIRVF